ncbi:MAG: DUF3037 domain-containing protein [Bryobacterales bacterium]|nr:DUF3037 domain-containing protein [Bryobacterales bacterium]
MRVAYSFSVLRYVHDPVTQEFINIGVAVFSPEAKYLRAVCTTRYGRITQMFQKIDGDHFRQLARYIENQICAESRIYESALPFESGPAIENLLARVLPPDDSAIQFSKPGVGLSGDLDRTLDGLYQRHVEQYTVADESPRQGNAGRQPAGDS